jgi:hypothetical protein
MGASTTTLPDTDIDTAMAVAQSLIDQYVDPATLALTIPVKVMDRALLLVTIEQLNQDNAPNGVLNQAFTDGLGDGASTPIRISRDPMKPALPILAPWISGRFFCA